MNGNGFAFVAALADALHNGNLSKQGHLHFFGQALHAFAAEEVVARLGKFGWREPCHVFDQAEYGHVHLVVTVHVNTLACIGQGYVLRSRNNDCARDGQVLEEGQVDVARARRSVEDEVVQRAPLCVGDELLEGVGGHAAAPECGRIGIDEEADGEDFDAILFGGEGNIFRS